MEEIMKRVALVLVALGLVFATAAPSFAHVYYGPAHHYYRGYVRPHYYGGYAPVVIAPAPVYGYATYPPVVMPVVLPVVTPAVPVAPGPYYYGAPGVGIGIRGPRVSIGVGL
jgi:hypothetical protein